MVIIMQIKFKMTTTTMMMIKNKFISQPLVIEGIWRPHFPFNLEPSLKTVNILDHDIALAAYK